jgi:hypothetical protein
MKSEEEHGNKVAIEVQLPASYRKTIEKSKAKVVYDFEQEDDLFLRKVYSEELFTNLCCGVGANIKGGKSEKMKERAI